MWSKKPYDSVGIGGEGMKINKRNVRKYCDEDMCVVHWTGDSGYFCKYCEDVKGKDEVEYVKCRIFGELNSEDLDKIQRLLE